MSFVMTTEKLVCLRECGFRNLSLYDLQFYDILPLNIVIFFIHFYPALGDEIECNRIGYSV